MSSRADATIPATRRPRKSTGHSPVRKRMDKENITVDVASTLVGNGGRKKSRSKSMGPGGLDVLKTGTGNRRVSLAAPSRPPPRSILKPTIPLLPEIPPHKPKGRNNAHGADNLSNAFGNDDSSSSGTKIALRTEEEQQAAAREREEKERAALEKEINDRREARRKSLANRRVSFAAEATLHTFHEIEYMQDSTTSTDSTRRASSSAARSPAPTPVSPEAADPPSTPPQQDDELVAESPAEQRNMQQRKRRRSSEVSSMSFHQGDDDTLASTIYSSDSDVTDGVIETHEEINSDSDSDSDDGTTLDVDEVTSTSIVSGRSMLSDDSNDTLDDALRLAARQAQTQSLDEEEEIIPSFGWGKKPMPKQQSSDQAQSSLSYTATAKNNDGDDDTGMDMDITHAMGGIIDTTLNDEAQNEDMSMDVTRILGGIITENPSQLSKKPASPTNSEPGSPFDDLTMDLTTAIGGIQQAYRREDDLLDLESNAADEDMSMELTTVMGGVLASKQGATSRRKSLPTRRRTMTAPDDDATMDMTIGLGRIIPAAPATTDTDDEVTMGMDMTMAIGGIIQGSMPIEDHVHVNHSAEQSVNRSGTVAKQSPRPATALIAPNVESPGLSPFRGQGIRHSSNARQSPTQKDIFPFRKSSPPKSSSPMKDGTPMAKRASDVVHTPPSQRSRSRSVSPQRDSGTGHKSSRGSPLKSTIFHQDPSTGVSTPRVILTPQPRRLSGVGADRTGLGSPRVALLIDRRGSIGEAATAFIPGKTGRGVTFANPRVMEQEVDKDREAEEDRENGRSILEREADAEDENNTANLKDMIFSMTPKKKDNPFKGRKSLHVGSAKGLLGKRPVELDDDDEVDEDRDGVKRLKGHQGSPVKNVRLHAPPTKAETTGRLTRSLRLDHDGPNDNTTTPTLVNSPGKAASSPKGFGRFRDVETDQATNTFSFEELPRIIDPNVQDDDDERIHLQDFLNMTSIRFMELNTTKRRHTQAPAAMQDSTSHKEGDISLERCVVAGACTVPMLELYQHSCRELKKYISEGRRIVREIETETFEENPPLFQEYISASPEFKVLMDNQFKNVKTHARLLSKAMWYEWRMKLQDGLKEGLIKISEGMEADDRLLQTKEELLKSVLPDLIIRSVTLEEEQENLQSVARELADCDPEDLRAARSELAELDTDIEAKMRQIEALRQTLKDTESSIGEITQRKEECIAAIQEAEKIREECRGWTSTEVNSLKAHVDAIEKQHGWAISGISGTMISMTYLKEIELVFDIASFRGSKPNGDIDLWYIAANRTVDPQPATLEKEFFVQCIRDYMRSLTQEKTRIADLLQLVSAAWRKANSLSDNIRLLNATFPLEVAKVGDSEIALKVALLLKPLETKVQIILGLRARNTTGGIEVSIIPHAQVIYGEHFKVDKVGEFLATRIGDSLVPSEGDTKESWSDVIVELHERLLARGRK
ncbi:hypothetical protein BX600DRAFT_374232 [Xylariales sp. PMI_506]|nr:hypothetical protein BX600DRAFT_374232 [Xylariales sp. PMI_506]